MLENGQTDDNRTVPLNNRFIVALQSLNEICQIYSVIQIFVKLDNV